MNLIDKLKKILSRFDLFPDDEELAKIANLREPLQIEGDSKTAEHFSPSSVDNEKNPLKHKCRVKNRLVATENIKQENLDNIALIAFADLSFDDNPAPDEDISMDWLLKFMDLAGNINDEFMQIVLGKILATEVKTPGHTSLRSLIQIASMSKDEMMLFINLSKFIITIDGEHLIMNDKEFNDRHGLLYASLLRLEDCGLVNANGTLSWNHTLYITKPLFILYGREALAVTGKKDRQKFSMQVFTMKETGKALWSLVKKKHDSQYLKDVKDFLSQQHKDLNVAYIEELDIPEGL